MCAEGKVYDAIIKGMYLYNKSNWIEEQDISGSIYSAMGYNTTKNY